LHSALRRLDIGQAVAATSAALCAQCGFTMRIANVRMPAAVAAAPILPQSVTPRGHIDRGSAVAESVSTSVSGQWGDH